MDKIAHAHSLPLISLTCGTHTSRAFFNLPLLLPPWPALAEGSSRLSVLPPIQVVLDSRPAVQRWSQIQRRLALRPCGGAPCVGGLVIAPLLVVGAASHRVSPTRNLTHTGLHCLAHMAGCGARSYDDRRECRTGFNDDDHRGPGRSSDLNMPSRADEIDNWGCQKVHPGGR
jgi:hypothetical protein